MQSDLRIVFMGTPEFAVASLEAMVTVGYNIVGVVTAPDKPAGRGMKLSESAVKKYAVEKGLFILQPEKLKNVDFLAQLSALKADLQVVVAFRMLPEIVWNMPPMGTINVHGSLLPQYRGAAPINWAIINGERETGVTTFKLKHEIDTGDILLQQRVPINDSDNVGVIHDRLKEAGAQVLLKTIEGLADGSLKEISQSSIIENKTTLRHAPKIFTETCKINWAKPVDEIYNLIRGLSPYPGAFAEINSKTLKIFSARKEKTNNPEPPGSICSDRKTYLKFATSDGYIAVDEIQLEGKKRMNIQDFLRGYR